MFLKGLKKILQSYILLPVLFTLALICWLFNLNVILLCSLSVVVLLIMLFADSVHNAFPLIFYASFYIPDIGLINGNWAFYITAIAIAILSMLYRFVLTLIKNKGHLRLGSIFFPLVVFDVAFLLGGVFSNFNLMAWFSVLAISVGILLVYLLAYNESENLDKFLPYAFIVGGLFVTVQYLFFYGTITVWTRNIIEKLWKSKFVADWQWANAAGPNNTALFMSIAAISCLTVCCGKKFDYLSLFASLLFSICVIITGCRTMTIALLLAGAPLVIINFIKSKNRILLIIVLLVLCLTGVVFFWINPSVMAKITANVLEKIRSAGSSGRLTQLWPWCWEKFLEHKWFGYGFISPENVVTIRESTGQYILAHNTLLQWLTSLGIVGTLLSGWFYFEKYKLTIKNLKTKNIGLSFIIFIVALNGITEQAAAMDTFAFMIPIIVLAAIENCLFKGKRGK